jgi:hypothetical protein
MGPVHFLAMLRQKYWISHGLQTVKSVDQCITCKRQLQRPELQQMCDLPEEMLTPDKAPFVNLSRCRLFRPDDIEIWKTASETYGCLITCLTTRAVHIEIAHNLLKDSFIHALQRSVVEAVPKTYSVTMGKILYQEFYVIAFGNLIKVDSQKYANSKK